MAAPALSTQEARAGTSNIVNLSERGRAARAVTAAESGRMLNDCRDLAMRRLSQSLHEMLAQIEEDLFQMAEATFEKEVHDLYLDVRGKAKEKWPRIEEAFARQFVDTFNRTLRGEVRPAIHSAAVSALELTLVDEDQLAESIALQQVAGNLRENCEDELSLLGERVAVLLGKNQLSDEENPISPQAVCSGLKAACDEIDGSLKQKLILLKQIERRVSDVLHTVYADLNSEMVRWDILPDLKHAYRRPSHSSAAAKPAAAPESQSGSGKSQAGDEKRDADLFSALQQLIQSRYTSAATGAEAMPLGAAMARAGQPAEAAEAAAVSLPPGAWLDSLTDMQRGDWRAPAAAEGDETPLPQLGPVGGATNVLREIKARAMAEGVGQLDAITIDIVAMLFDFIFDDAKIPDPIKGLVGRLQIPVLKVAMLDKTFFSSKTHPARKLLDSIAQAAIGWGSVVDQDDQLYQELSFIVGRIQIEFERDVQVFTDAINLLGAVVAERDARAETIAERSADLMRQRETEEIAWIIAGEAVSRRDSSAVPEALRGFLVQHWQHVLKELCLRYGEDHHAYLSAVATMEDLLWSVTPKENGEERRQLVGTLPGLLRALHAGLDSIALSQETRREFFDQLVGLHSAAVRAGLGAAAPAVVPAITETPAPLAIQLPAADQYSINPEGELLVTRITQDDVQIDEVALVGARTEAAGADIYRGWVSQLKRGDWVEFRQNDGSATRARLSWISPQRGVYLFTNPQSPRATSISPDALTHQFRVGLAEIIADEPMFDRAVSGVLGTLQAA